jgi:hypothetical protein
MRGAASRQPGNIFAAVIDVRKLIPSERKNGGLSPIRAAGPCHGRKILFSRFAMTQSGRTP